MRFRVLKAVAATFAYLAEHWPVVLKAMWLPALIVAGLQVYAAPAMFSSMAEFVLLGPNPDPEIAAAAISRLGGAMIFYFIAGFIFFPMLTVASLRHIIRGEEPQLPFYFNYGADETRIMGANFLFNLMVVVIAVIADLALGVLLVVIGLLGPAAAAALKGVGSVATQAVTGWFQVRMSTLFPAVMATRSLGLGVAFDVTRRDWLALIAYWILIGLVILPVILVLLSPAAFPLVGDMAKLGQNNPAATAAFFQKLSAALEPSSPGFWMAAAGLLLTTLIVNAIVNVASAVAWRYLAAERDGATR